MVDPRRVRQLLDRIADEQTHLQRLSREEKADLMPDHEPTQDKAVSLVVFL